jgi:hypothetical protein
LKNSCRAGGLVASKTTKGTERERGSLGSEVRRGRTRKIIFLDVQTGEHLGELFWGHLGFHLVEGLPEDFFDVLAGLFFEFGGSGR